jgi:SAM-dependent methyltransferase
VKHQILVDIRKLVKTELVNSSIEKLRRLEPSTGLSRVPEKYLSPGEEQETLRECYGIDYIAPCDARETKIKENSVDFISSTNTLEHIPPRDIVLILKECHRLLKPNGILSFLIDYKDHYSYCDSGIGPYNFLQYSASEWKIYNPPFHYQNRLRHSDYCAIVAECWFDIEQEVSIEADAGNLQDFNSLAIHPSFESRYSPQQLMVKSSHIVLRKQAVNHAANRVSSVAKQRA